MLFISGVMLFFPDKQVTLLGMLIGPINSCFKMNLPAKVKRFKKFSLAISLLAILSLFLIWFPNAFFADVFQFNQVVLIRIFSVLVALIAFIEYVHHYQEGKT
jgi:hypothetical protein